MAELGPRCFYEPVAHSNKLIVRMGWARNSSCKLEFLGRYSSPGAVAAEVSVAPVTWIESR